LYRPFLEDEAQQGRLLRTETPGKGGVGTRAVGGVPRFYLSAYLANIGLSEYPFFVFFFDTASMRPAPS
ncbi:MAG: hypothetical protein AB2816_09660, partial [Candidatus Thiodiazotropha endolucinida]